MLRTAESEAERSATWLELFYDLVFVVAVANLGHRLLVDTTWETVFGYVALFIPVWWAWASYTFYADRYDTDDLGQRMLAVLQMIAIALMAVSISGDTADSTRAFAIANVMAWLVIIAMYARARRNVEGTRDLVTGYIQGFSIATAIWFVSIFVDPPFRYWLWAIGQFISMYTPYYFRKIQAKVPLDASHLPERFGLFTILVLGESIAATVAGLAHVGWEPAPTLTAIIGVVIASSLWWLYFDNLDGKVVRRRPEQARTWKPTVWLFSHLPLAIALVAAGIGMEFLIEHTSEELPTVERWLVIGGVAASLVAMALLHLATVSDNPLRRDPLRARIRIGSAALLLVLAFSSAGLSAVPIAILVMLVLIGQVAADVIIQVRARDEEREFEAGPEPQDGGASDSVPTAPADDPAGSAAARSGDVTGVVDARAGSEAGRSPSPPASVAQDEADDGARQSAAGVATADSLATTHPAEAPSSAEDDQPEGDGEPDGTPQTDEQHS
jgi:low temperature requirement protein LtrA